VRGAISAAKRHLDDAEADEADTRLTFVSGDGCTAREKDADDERDERTKKRRRCSASDADDDEGEGEEEAEAQVHDREGEATIQVSEEMLRSVMPFFTGKRSQVRHQPL
jgi:hypothetical protein